MPSSSRARAVFFDRDGVLNPLIEYPQWGADSPSEPEHLRLYPDAASAIRSLREVGFLAILASNQPGVAKAKYSFTTFQAIDRRLSRLLLDTSATLDGRFYCLHHPDAVVAQYRVNCECRKPKPGLLHAAALEFGLNLGECYFIGDTERDTLTAEAAGCIPLLLARQKRRSQPQVGTARMVSDLNEAARQICKEAVSYVA